MTVILNDTEIDNIELICLKILCPRCPIQLYSAKEGEYQNQEISNLARFISVIKFRPIMWRQNHSYVLCDRIEDMTDPSKVDAEPKDSIRKY